MSSTSHHHSSHLDYTLPHHGEPSSGITAQRHSPHPGQFDSYLDQEGSDMESDSGEDAAFWDMPFAEILDELYARFLLNLPEEEMEPTRVYWQAEQAHWFYEDYIRPLNPQLPALNQRNFSHLIITSSPLYAHLSDADHDKIWVEYVTYKKMVPCCGAIMVNMQGDKVLMVRGWKSNAGWCFPRGKINSEESVEDCAVREVFEETGFDLTGQLNIRHVIKTQANGQDVTMFLVKDIDETTQFETQTLKEIGAIEWVPLKDLPTWTGKKGSKKQSEKTAKKFYNVTPFVGPLKKWLGKNRKSGISPAIDPLTPSALKPLEPFKFDSAPSTPTPKANAMLDSTSLSRGDSTTFNNLFHRFMEAQAAEQNDFAVTPQERDRGLASTNVQTVSHDAEKERHAQEDDALAKLLGGMSSSTPAPFMTATNVSPPSSTKADKLMSILAPTSNLSAAGDTDRKSQVKPHHASLLSVLSTGHTAMNPTRSQQDPQTLPRQSSLPTSPRPPSPTYEQLERTRKQKALLDQITAGIGLDILQAAEVRSVIPQSEPQPRVSPSGQSYQSNRAVPQIDHSHPPPPYESPSHRPQPVGQPHTDVQPPHHYDSSLQMPPGPNRNPERWQPPQPGQGPNQSYRPMPPVGYATNPPGGYAGPGPHQIPPNMPLQPMSSQHMQPGGPGPLGPYSQQTYQPNQPFPPAAHQQLQGQPYPNHSTQRPTSQPYPPQNMPFHARSQPPPRPYFQQPSLGGPPYPPPSGSYPLGPPGPQMGQMPPTGPPMGPMQPGQGLNQPPHPQGMHMPQRGNPAIGMHQPMPRPPNQNLLGILNDGRR